MVFVQFIQSILMYTDNVITNIFNEYQYLLEAYMQVSD